MKPKPERRPAAAASHNERSEHWRLDAGDDAVATLLVPPHASRERRFEISCSMSVQRVDDAELAWHQLRVLADGQQQWQRRVDTHAGIDGLDYRFERRVPPGQGLRIGVEVASSGARRRSLLIEVDEVRD
ncbi:hypothetical protein [Piscinibacter sakaiensis]|uniref:hypothetical protein n=1 Tax=Piscinibacter sakaiensis TaxID=1547922 RepID=UPI003AAB0DE7